MLVDDDLMTVGEVAAMLNVKTSWVYERIRARKGEKLPYIKLGRYVRFEKEAVWAFLKRQRKSYSLPREYNGPAMTEGHLLGKKMAQKQPSYGSGSVIKRGKGLVIRWREKEITPDGRARTVHRCKALGEVTKKEANEKLREELSKSAIPKVAPVTFKDFTTSWKMLVLPGYPKHST